MAMNNLDRLRDDLRAEPAAPLPVIDLDGVMRAGRRIRHRRRVSVAAAAGLLVAVIGGASIGVAGLRQDRPVAPQHAVSPSPSASATGRQTVPTGVHVSGGEIVLYAVPLSSPDLPGVSFGLTAGVRSGSGAVRGLVTMNETSGSDHSPGFHAVAAPSTHNGVAVPQFGYYAGPAVKITGRVGGEVVRAGSAALGREDIVVFWFGPAARGTVTGLTAYDRTGRKLPTGSNAPGGGG
jgi:hypothetical protein